MLRKCKLFKPCKQLVIVPFLLIEKTITSNVKLDELALLLTTQKNLNHVSFIIKKKHPITGVP